MPKISAIKVKITVKYLDPDGTVQSEEYLTEVNVDVHGSPDRETIEDTADQIAKYGDYFWNSERTRLFFIPAPRIVSITCEILPDKPQ